MAVLNKVNYSFGSVILNPAKQLVYRYAKKITALFWNNVSAGQNRSSALPATTLGNSILITDHGRESIDWKLHLLKNAKESIEFSGNFCGGEVFRRALDNIRFALEHSPSLRVRLLLSEDNLEKTDLVLLKALARDCPDRFTYLITKRMFRLFPFSIFENHVKMLVVDEKYYVVGGTNFYPGVDTRGDGADIPTKKSWTLAGLAMSPYYRDFDLVGRGHMAGQNLRKEFYQLFEKWHRNMRRKDEKVASYFPISRASADIKEFDANPRLTHDVALKVLRSDPKKKSNIISEQLVKLIHSLNRSQRIFIGNFFFNLSDQMFVALSNAVDRHIEVKVITNGMLKTSPKSSYVFCHPHRMMSWALTRNQFQGYEFAVPQTTYHTKAIVIGDSALVGSYNLGPRSEFSDDEIGLLIESPACSKAIEERLKRDISLSRPVPHPSQVIMPKVQKFAGMIYRRFFSQFL